MPQIPSHMSNILYASKLKTYVKYTLCFKYNMPNYMSQIYVLSSTYVLYVLSHNNPLLPSHRSSYTICLKFMSRITTCVVSSNQLQINYAQICLIQYSSQIQCLCVHLLCDLAQAHGSLAIKQKERKEEEIQNKQNNKTEEQI